MLLAKVLHSFVLNSSRITSMTRFSAQIRHGSRLVYHEHGSPEEVVLLEHVPDPEDNPKDPDGVIVNMQLAPINPADLNAIQGTYPITPRNFPAVGGGEGVGVVFRVGPEVRKLKVGDWVVPVENMAGTWSTFLDTSETKLIKVPNDIPLEAAAGIRVNPGTAFQMLHDFVRLSPGDVVIQNGANSGCGQNVIQIAKWMGLETVNIVRNRDDIETVKSDLKSLGADHVWTEEELRESSDFRSGKIAKPRLALNCVGGTSSTDIAKPLAKGAVHVTYGGMSRKPVTISTSSLIFKDISVRGFWFSRWIGEWNVHGTDCDSRQDNIKSREELFVVLGQLVRDGHLRAPKVEVVPLKDYREALSTAARGFKKAKIMLDLQN